MEEFGYLEDLCWKFFIQSECKWRTKPVDWCTYPFLAHYQDITTGMSCFDKTVKQMRIIIIVNDIWSFKPDRVCIWTAELFLLQQSLNSHNIWESVALGFVCSLLLYSWCQESEQLSHSKAIGLCCMLHWGSKRLERRDNFKHTRTPPHSKHTEEFYFSLFLLLQGSRT